MITKVVVRNYRRFRKFELELQPGTNILVGKNDTGKSTLIEAVSLALTGRVNGRLFGQELNPFYVNLEATADYAAALAAGELQAPPEIVIDVFLDASDDTEILRGTNNLHSEDACGVRIHAKLSADYAEEYANFVVAPSEVRLVPTEYYRVDWLGFSGSGVTGRSVPATASVIDASTIRLQSGVDYHLQQIIRTHLDPKERVELSRQYRSLREEFASKENIKAINERLDGGDSEITDRSLSLSIDISQRYTWESSLVAHIDDLPFQFIGRGEQNAVKTLLAMGRKAEDAHIVLVEEPETHLSFGSLRKLIPRIQVKCEGKQSIIATHSTFVLNKLGLQNLILLGDGTSTRLSDLPSDTSAYFQKLAGFDTLRLVLAEKAILVEGPSDELIVQRAYLDRHGHLPLDDGIDVISVGLSHKRFLDVATRLGRRVWVVTDNDGKTAEEVVARFAGYADSEFVSIHTGENPKIRTLEPQIYEANDLKTLNEVLGTTCDTRSSLLTAMERDKTGTALKIFEAEKRITMPAYIQEAVCGE